MTVAPLRKKYKRKPRAAVKTQLDRWRADKAGPAQRKAEEFRSACDAAELAVRREGCWGVALRLSTKSFLSRSPA